MVANGDAFSLTQSECSFGRSESQSALILAQNVSRASSKSAVSVFIIFFLFIFLMRTIVAVEFSLHFFYFILNFYREGFHVNHFFESRCQKTKIHDFISVSVYCLPYKNVCFSKLLISFSRRRLDNKIHDSILIACACINDNFIE